MKFFFPFLIVTFLISSCGPAPQQASTKQEKETAHSYEIISKVSGIPNQQGFQASVYLITLNDSLGVTLEKAKEFLEANYEAKKPSDYFVTDNPETKLLYHGRDDLSSAQVVEVRKNARESALGHIYVSDAGSYVRTKDEW